MNRNSRKKHKDSFFYKTLRFITKYIIVKYYRVSFINSEQINNLKPPYIVLPNHCSFFDPFLVNAPIYEKFHYIVSDAQFRNPIQKYLLRLTDAIPITKNTNDLNSLKKMTEAAKKGKIIGLFPEGKRNWDGATVSIIESTTKLVRMLNIPVVVPHIEGGFLMNPRWGTSFRRGRVYITYKLLFDGQKPGRMKISEISNALVQALDHNEYTSEKLIGQKFKSSKRAEKIEQVVYLCPQCHSISSFHSKGNDFTCSSCNYSVHYNEMGYLKAHSGNNHFDNLFEWNNWQKSEAEKILKKSQEDELIFVDENLFYMQPDESGRLKKKGKGNLSFYRDRIEFHEESSLKYLFKLDDIKGINVQQHERLEFYHDKQLYCFYSKEKQFSALKVNEFFDLARSL